MMLTWVWLNDVNNDNSVAQMRNAKVQNVREFYTANKYFLRKLFFFFGYFEKQPEMGSSIPLMKRCTLLTNVSFDESYG